MRRPPIAHSSLTTFTPAGGPHPLSSRQRLGRRYTMAEPVVIARALYRRDSERNGKVVDAISLRTGAVDGGWLEAARAMAFLVQQGTSREAEQTARQLGRLPYSRCSFERVAHLVGELYASEHADIADALIADYQVPRQARGVSVSLDRSIG